MVESEATRALSRIEPFDELDFFREPFGLARLMGRGWPSIPKAAQFVPAVGISEDDDQYVITAEVPGAKKEDVTVEVHDNVMTIRGEKRSEREETKEQMRYVERTYGSFSRSFTLPANAAGDRVNATFVDGVLSVTVAKAEESKPKVISIK